MLDAVSGEESCLRVLMDAARVFAGITAESVAQVGESITLPQLRVLVLASSRPGSSISAVAEALDVHLSNATRICDRLVHAGLLERRESVADRRRVEVHLTPAGAAVVEAVAAHRRTAIHRLLRTMPSDDQRVLAAALGQFVTAATEDEERRRSSF
jgi:DNA-binding MarR family transcriptional regulator